MYYFKLVEDGEIISVEAKSVNVASSGFIPATKDEFNAFIAALPPEPEPEPNPDIIRAAELLSNSPDVITQPEMWELMRIFGRLLHIPS